MHVPAWLPGPFRCVSKGTSKLGVKEEKNSEVTRCQCHSNKIWFTDSLEVQLENMLEAAGENKRLPGTSRTGTQQRSVSDVLKTQTREFAKAGNDESSKTRGHSVPLCPGCSWQGAQKCRSLMTVSDFHTSLRIPTPPLQARVKVPQIECRSFNRFCLSKQGFKQKGSTLSTEHKNAALTAVTCYTGLKSRQDY